MQRQDSMPGTSSHHVTSRWLRSRLARVVTLAGGITLTVTAGAARLVESGVRAAMEEPWEPPQFQYVWGDEAFETPNGAPAIYVEQIPVTKAPDRLYSVRVINGWNGTSLADSFEVRFNGAVHLTHEDLNGGTSVMVPVLPQDTNTLEVTVAGQAGDFIQVAIVSDWDPYFTIFGPETYTRGGGTPVFVADTFALHPAAGPAFQLYMVNGDSAGGNLPDSVIVELNDAVLWSGDDIAGARTLAWDVATLDSINVLETKVFGATGAQSTIWVAAKDTTAPLVNWDVPVDGYVTGDTLVTVSGSVENESSTWLVAAAGTGQLGTAEHDTVSLGLGVGGPFSFELRLVEGSNYIFIGAGNALQLFDDDNIRWVTLDTQAPSLSLTQPAEGFLTSADSIEVSGTVSDDTEVEVTANGLPLVVNGGSFSGRVPLIEGTNVITITATDAATNASYAVRNVVRDAAPPILTVTSPQDQLVTEDDSVTVSGNVVDSTTVAVTANTMNLPVDGQGDFTGRIALVEGVNEIVVRAEDELGNISADTLTVTRGGEEELPPDPDSVAPPIDPTVATTVYSATEFIWAGPDTIQFGVEPGTIEPMRVATMRGRVIDRDSTALEGVHVTVTGNPEFGYTRTREDGVYDIVVNGGGAVVLTFEKSGYLKSQRQVEVAWQDWTHIGDLVLVKLDSAVTAVSPDTATGIQVARGSLATDADGGRRATVLFKPGTEAEMVFADGSKQPLETLNVRATEYTVGEDGPSSMPGPLPAGVAYTYAVELSVDEAEAAGASGVEFSKPVAFHVENFLGFPVGLEVPVAWWDRTSAAWVPETNGRVIEIVSITGGVADIDIDGDGMAEDSTGLYTLGIDHGERERLASLYATGTSLWRAQTTHFSPLDLNFPLGLLDGLRGLLDWLKDLFDRSCLTSGSIIECQNQVLGEQVGVTGTDYTLNYRSDRVPGRASSRTLEIPISGDSIPETLLRIELVIEVAGRRFEHTFPAEPNQSFTFTWDGLDAFGRQLQGGQPANVRLGYVYPFFYLVPPSTAQSFGMSCTGSGSGSWMEACVIPTSINGRARQEETLWTERSTTLGTWDARSHGLGGWTLDAHHHYDPVAQVLYLGNGSRRSASDVSIFVETAVGLGLDRPTDVYSAPDGSLYIADPDVQRIRRVDPNGILTTVAGNGQSGFSGDGGPATEARLNYPAGVFVTSDGTLYIAEDVGNRVRKVSPDGIISTVAGTGQPGYSGDGGLATAARLFKAKSVVVGSDGSLFIADRNNHRIRRVSPSGIITTVAGTGSWGFSGDGGPAVAARLSHPEGIALADDGSLFISDLGNNRVRRIDPSGIITTVAGVGTAGFSGDGGAAMQAELNGPGAISLGADGSLYVADTNNNRIRRIRPDGSISTIVGAGTAGYAGDGGPAMQALLRSPRGVSVARDGSIYIADYYNSVVRRARTALPGFTDSEIAIASEDGSELYRFDASGRHLSTVHALTGAVLYSFSYDTAGRLATVTDGDGLVTSVERGGEGSLEGIRGPYGQMTDLALDGTGFLQTIANPAADTMHFVYTNAGLLTEFRDARGNLKEYGYDALGRLELAEDPAGGSKTLVRSADPNNLNVEITTALDRTNTYAIEPLPTGAELWTNTDPAGLSTVSTLRADGTTTSDPDGTATSVVEDGDPRFAMQLRLVKSGHVEMPSGLELAFTAGRRVTLADASNVLSLTALVDSVIVNGRKFRSSYTQSSRTFTHTTPLNRVSVERVDSLGRVVKDSVAGIAAWTYEYDGDGRLARVQQGAREYEYAYDTLGRLAAVTDPLDRTVSLEYDAAGRLTRQTLPDSNAIEFGYDANGNLTSLTPPGKPAHTFSYDAVDQVQSYTAPDLGSGSTTTEYTFDLDRQLTRVLRQDSTEIVLAYDTAGRVSTVAIPRGTYDHAYDPATGQLASVTSPDSVTLDYTYDGALLTGMEWMGEVSGSVDFTYDSNFRIAEQRVNEGAAVAFQYDNDGLLTVAGALTVSRDPANGRLTGTTLGSVSTSQTYDALGDLASYTARFGSDTLFHTVYTRDGLGRITRLVETIEGVTDTLDYSYDVIGRLADVERNGAVVESYEFDANGNRTSFTGPSGTVTAAYDDQDRLLTYGDASYGYTTAGELAMKVVGTDTTRYEYDPLGNLVEVRLAGGTLIEYAMDGQHRRVGRRRDEQSFGALLYGDQLNPIAQLDTAGNVTASFVYGSRANVPDYMVKAGTAYRILADHLGSPRLVVDVGTGVVAERIDYDAHGRIIADTEPGFQPFAFAGGVYDGDAALVRFGWRDYDPGTGRWSIKDPILFAGGSSNLYAYALEDPVNLIDPDGLQAIWDIPDWISAGLSLRDLACNPSWGNAGWFGLDLLGAALPLVPAAGTVRRAADFVVTPRGQAIHIPRGATGPTPTRAPGVQYVGGSGGRGLDSRVTGIRIMEGNANQGPRVIYMNSRGQTVDPTTGRTVPNADPRGHHYLDPW